MPKPTPEELSILNRMTSEVEADYLLMLSEEEFAAELDAEWDALPAAEKARLAEAAESLQTRIAELLQEACAGKI